MMSSQGLWKRWGFLAVVCLGLLATLQACTIPSPLPPPPATLSVEGAGPLAINVVKMEKRPLKAVELSPYGAKGFRWDYTVRFRDTGGIGVTISRLRMAVKSDAKPISSVEQPFQLRIDPREEAQAFFHATLSTLTGEAESLIGVHEVVLEGKSDKGGEVKITLLVPLQ